MSISSSAASVCSALGGWAGSSKWSRTWPFDDLHHEAVERPAARGHRLQDLERVAVILEGSLHGLDLAPDPAGPMEELGPVAHGMGHGSYTILGEGI